MRRRGKQATGAKGQPESEERRERKGALHRSEVDCEDFTSAVFFPLVDKSRVLVGVGNKTLKVLAGFSGPKRKWQRG